MKTVRQFIQHNVNSLHVYCRLCDHIPCHMAKKIARLYDKTIQRLVYII
ncbi:hypothetical protein [Syntrophobacter fumaroxidans]|nr:hypothetical protein [Syntrophobacter fumaroxidans]